MCTYCCVQIGDMKYVVSGLGLLPKPAAPANVTVASSAADASQSLIIPFRNPFELPVGIECKLLQSMTL